MYKQQGSWPDQGVGGLFPGFLGYRDLLVDPSSPGTKPNYESILFPKTGVMLRNGVSDRETQLHMIAGSNHAHYDNDSGSVTIWGKGRIVADDFGYEGYAPIHDHNMLDTTTGGTQMDVQEFSAAPQFDYVNGKNGAWHRRVAFVKDPDPDAPNYFVLRDTMEAPDSITWRLWLSAQNLSISGQQILAEGKEDVDTDIVFLQPQGVTFTTEDKTTKTYGLDDQAYYRLTQRTQTGLITSQPSGTEYLVVIYPRWKTQQPPEVRALSDQVIMVKTEVGMDVIFLGDAPFSFAQGNIQFEGTSGLIKTRAGKTELALGAPGHLAAGGQVLDRTASATVR